MKVESKVLIRLGYTCKNKKCGSDDFGVLIEFDGAWVEYHRMDRIFWCPFCGEKNLLLTVYEKRGDCIYFPHKESLPDFMEILKICEKEKYKTPIARAINKRLNKYKEEFE